VAEAQTVQKQRHRSPNYPAISLPEAVERITKLHKADGPSGSPIESAVRHFGFNRAHGTAMVLVSALRKYGLIEVSGGRVTLTQRGLSIVVYPEGDARRQAAIREAALAPEIYAELYSRFLPAGKIVSEQTLKAELQLEMKFNPKAVSDFVRDFKETLIYAGLLAEDGVTLRSGGDGASLSHSRKVPDIGDYVDWELNGVLQFREPKRIRGFSEDGQYAFVDDSKTGLPIGELTVKERPLDAANNLFNVPPKTSTMREDIFSLAEGQVKIQWPTPLSQESIQDLKDWLKILERKIARSALSEKSDESV
jgi:hypothetical protein